MCFSHPCKDLPISLTVPITLSRRWHAEQTHCETKEKGSTDVGKDSSARTDPPGQYHGGSHEGLHCSVKLLSTKHHGEGYHWEARKTPGGTWTSETLELAGILKLSQSRPLLVGNWDPGGKNGVLEHKNWKWEESFEIRQSSHYHCIPYLFGPGNPLRCLLKIKIQSSSPSPASTILIHSTWVVLRNIIFKKCFLRSSIFEKDSALWCRDSIRSCIHHAASAWTHMF